MSAPATGNPVPRQPHLDDYAAIVGGGEIHELRQLAERLSGRSIKMVNSTAVGGGVAEILNGLMPLFEDLDVDARWDVLKGNEAFYEVTKAFHNAIHGGHYEDRPEWFETFLRVTEENRQTLDLSQDFVVLHDPQPAALIPEREGRHGHWIWRCHIDSSRPNPKVWNFLRPYVERFDAALFSSPSFTQGLPIPQYLFYPSIDPLSEKNRELAPDYIAGVLERFGIDAKRPILTQVSRFDRLKDPVGVIQAYKQVRKYKDCQLVLAGGSASDDPEGQAVLHEVNEAAGNDPDIHILDLPPDSHLVINALQRASTIVIQKSLREGFGLTVTEALLKRRPVIASAVGGIPIQVIHKVTGMLTHSVEGTAYQIRYLLSNEGFAEHLGQNGYEHVKQNFLLTQNLKRYLILFLSFLR